MCVFCVHMAGPLCCTADGHSSVKQLSSSKKEEKRGFGERKSAWILSSHIQAVWLRANRFTSVLSSLKPKTWNIAASPSSSVWSSPVLRVSQRPLRALHAPSLTAHPARHTRSPELTPTSSCPLSPMLYSLHSSGEAFENLDGLMSPLCSKPPDGSLWYSA